MRICKILTLIAVGALAFAPMAHAQCSDPPLAGKSPFLLKTSMWMTTTLAPDYFACGTAAGQTPATCTLHNRVYAQAESLCVNEEFLGAVKQPPVFYDPTAYDVKVLGQRYETSTISPPNWPGPLGAENEVWVMTWNHLAGAGDPDCIGYYAAQADVLQFGETGNARVTPCEPATAPISCSEPVRGVEANSCIPINTPYDDPGTVDVGDVPNLGGMAAVPIPTVAGTSAPNDFAAPGAAADLSWIPACAWTSHDGAPSPIMGYIVEAYVDTNADGVCVGPPICDELSDGVWSPILEIAPVAGIPALAYQAGDGAATGASVPYALLAGIAAPAPLSAIDCAYYRLRIQFLDDRMLTPPGGLNGTIDPVASAPSGHSAPVLNEALPSFVRYFVGNLDKGNKVNLSWEVTTDSYNLFTISKAAERQGPFQTVGDVRGVPGQVQYEFTDDSARAGGFARGNAIFYRLEASGPGGTEEAIIAVPVKRGKKD